MIYEIKQVTFSYPGSDRKVLDRADLTLSEGRILCILGPNGAGKTTLLNCMAGLLQPQSGQISLCGRALETMKEKDIARLVGYVPQLHTPAFDYRVLDFVLMGRSPQMGAFGRPKAGDEAMCLEVLESMGIGHLADKSYRNISGGERQQVLIARAIVQQPKVVLFDEPTAHLDYGNQLRVMERIRGLAKAGYTVILSTHNPEHALLFADISFVLQDGEVKAAGPSEEVLTEELMRQLYGVDVRLMEVDTEKTKARICVPVLGEMTEKKPEEVEGSR